MIPQGNSQAKPDCETSLRQPPGLSKMTINNNGRYHLENGECSRIKELKTDNQMQCMKLD